MMTMSLLPLLLLVSLLLLANPAFAIPVEKRSLFNGLFDGRVSYFHPETEGGAVGACGPRENDHSRIVALNLHQYGDQDTRSEWCNKKILIMHEDKEVEAIITDACPGCADKSLDATPHVFAQLGLLKTGILRIKWCVLGTHGCKSKTHKKHHGKKKGHK